MALVVGKILVPKIHEQWNLLLFFSSVFSLEKVHLFDYLPVVQPPQATSQVLALTFVHS